MVYGIQGYGKTTLVAGWLHDQFAEVRVAWVSARPSKGDVERFAAHALTELDAQRFVGAARPAEDAQAATDVLLGQLGGVLRASRAAQFVLVIDDAHWLLDDGLLLGLIDLAARFERFSVVVCSRSRHPIQLLAAGRVDVEVVPARELLLSPAEIGELAARMSLPLAPAHAQELYEVFGGWIAAVLLVLSEIDDSSDSADRVLPLARVAHYLRDIVLPGIGERDRLEMIMRLSLAERLSHRLIEHIAREEGQDPPSLVRLVESPGLAERRYEDDDVVLVWPRFIRDNLRTIYTGSHPETAKTTHQRMARWFAASSAPDALALALRHVAAAQDWEMLQQLWSRRTAELMFNHAEALAAVLDVVPEAVIAKHVGLQVARDVWHAAGSVGNDRDLLVALRTYAESSRGVVRRGLDGLQLHDLLFVGTGYLVAERLDGRLAEADTVADEIDRLAAAQIGHRSDPGDLLAWFHFQRGLTQTLRADHACAARHYEKAWQHRRRTAAVVAANTAANLALTHALAADPTASRHWLDRYRVLQTESYWGHEVACVGALAAEVLLALDRLDPAKCNASLETLTRRAVPLELWPIVAYVKAATALHYGEPAAALAELDSTQPAHSPAVAPAAALLLTRARADLLLAAGQGQRAGALLDSHNAETHPQLAVPLVRLHLLAGDPEEARRIAAASLWDEITDRGSRQELWMLHALASLRLGDLQTSSDMTRRSLATYRDTRQLRPFTTLAKADLQGLLDAAGVSLPFADLIRVMRHRNPFDRKVTFVQLTPRERTLLEQLMTGATRQQIADRLYLSVNTVRSQLTTLYRKLGVTRREEAVARSAEYGLVRSR